MKKLANKNECALINVLPLNDGRVIISTRSPNKDNIYAWNRAYADAGFTCNGHIEIDIFAQLDCEVILGEEVMYIATYNKDVIKAIKENNEQAIMQYAKKVDDWYEKMHNNGVNVFENEDELDIIIEEWLVVDDERDNVDLLASLKNDYPNG